MKILGIGVDIIKNDRIRKLIKSNKFKSRIYTAREIKLSKKTKNKIAFFSKRFAAKEAAAKALGTGFRNGVFWRDLEVTNLPSGKPMITFHGNSQLQLKKIANDKEPDISLTITDEFPYAQAIVTIN